MTESKPITRKDLQPYWEAIGDALDKIEDQRPKGLAGFDAAHLIAENAILKLFLAAQMQTDDHVGEEDIVSAARVATRYGHIKAIQDLLLLHMEENILDEDGHFIPYEDSPNS